MPPPSFFTRAKRIFQNAAQSPQSDQPHLSPTHSASHSQYETDGSSYEMLVVDTPSKPRKASRQKSQSNQHKHQRTEPDQQLQQPNFNEPKQNEPQQQKHSSEKPTKQQEPEQPSEPRTPPPMMKTEPHTPSQKLPAALRRINATPINVPDTPGYNLRSRTRSQAPPTPRQRPTPRTRRRELRQAPSARTTSGIAGRPSIVSRHQIDESSYVTLRALCRSFGLPTTGTKAELRARAVEKFELHRVLDEQTQTFENDIELGENLRDAAAGVRQPKDNNDAKSRNEENSGAMEMVTPTKASKENTSGERCEQESGKQITTSTVKPAGRGKQLPVEASIPARSDEPSVHAKSDAPENDPRREEVNPAECSTANSPVPVCAQEAEKITRPTVSSTGVDANSPDSPMPPPPHSTPRLSDQPFPFPTQRRPDGPTESVDARGGDIDVATVFQELASGRRKLSPAEYEAALRTLSENAPDRKQPVQVPINVARVSLSSLPTTPLFGFKPPSAPLHAAVSGAMPSQSKSPMLVNDQTVQCSRVPLNSSVLPQANAGKGNAAEKSDYSRITAPKQTRLQSPTQALQPVEKENAEPAEQKTSVPPGQEPSCGGEGDNVNSNRNKERRPIRHQPTMHTEQRTPELPPKSEPSSSANAAKLASSVQLEPGFLKLNQNPLPSLFQGARGGPHEGNIVDRRVVHTPVPNPKAAPVITERSKDLKVEKEDGRTEKKGDGEVTRSGFATPRELVRRFNRFRNDRFNEEEDVSLKAHNDGDPASSLLRRNARRSTSGVPLFYSARGPSTAGRAIIKTRTSSKAREAQYHLRRKEHLHDISGRASFRVKRTLSASAGALLVDLRRANDANVPPVERINQRGSFQAELARRPPPMAASALRILNDLQKIQEENSAKESRKRPTQPPPLPPSVVKRARRSGQFASRGSRSDQSLPAERRDRSEPLGKDANVSLFALDRTSDAKESGSSIPLGRRTPKLPPIAFGAGNKRSKRSRSSRLTSVPLSVIEDHVDKETERKGIRDKDKIANNDTDIPRAKRRRQQQDMSNIEDQAQSRVLLDDSTKMPVRGTKSVMLSSINTPQGAQAEEQPFRGVKAGQLDNSGVHASFANSAKDDPFKFPQQKEAEQRPLSLNPPSGFLKPESEAPLTVEKRASEKEYGGDRTPSSTGKESFGFNRPITILQSTTDRQNAQQKRPAKTNGTNLFTEVTEKKSNVIREQQSEFESPLNKDKTAAKDKFLVTSKKQDTADSTAELCRSDALPPQQPQDTNISFPTTQSPKDNGVQAPTGSSEPSFQDPKAPVGSNLGFPSSPFASPVKSLPFERKKETPEGEKQPEERLSEGISIPSMTPPSFGAVGGKQGSARIVSAPSLPNAKVDSATLFAFRASPFGQTEAKSRTQEKEAFSSLPKKDSNTENEGTPAGLALQPAPAVSVFSAGSREAGVPTSKPTSHDNAEMESGKQLGSNANLFPIFPAKSTFGVQRDVKTEGLSSPKASVPLSNNAEASAVTKSHDPPNSTHVLALTPQPSTVGVKLQEKAAVSNPLKDGDAVRISDKPAGPFANSPFSKSVEEDKTKASFSSSAQEASGKAHGGPFVNTQFKSPFSSSNSSNMFVFGSSVGNAAAVKPAPSIGVTGRSVTEDEGKSNPFAIPPATTPFNSQSAGQQDGTNKQSGPIFGMPTSSGSGAPGISAASGFGSSFGSSPALFNADASKGFAAVSGAQPLGGSSAPNTSIFGTTNVQSTSLGKSSDPSSAQILGTTSSGLATSNIFAASSGGTSDAGFGGTAPGSLTFGNANIGNFGSNNSQPNLFNQNGNSSSMSSAGIFGTAQAGAFSMGSATRATPQRRWLRGKRTFR